LVSVLYTGQFSESRVSRLGFGSLGAERGFSSQLGQFNGFRVHEGLGFIGFRL
jgi:hypothetical protein